MPLIRAQKVDLVAKLTEELKDSRIALVFAYTGLNMKANDSLRTRAFESGAKVKMLSNNLLKLILKNVGREMEIPSKQLAVAYGFQDEVEAAKTLVTFSKETETLEILGGWIDGDFFDASQVKTLSALPGKDALQAQLVGRLGGLIGSLAYSLNFPLQKLAFVVEAVRTTKPEETTQDVNEAPAVEKSKEENEEVTPMASEESEEVANETSAQETKDSEENKQETKEEKENNE